MISGQQKKRLTGVGPAYLAWEASVLPMYYSRIINTFYAEYKNFSITIFYEEISRGKEIPPHQQHDRCGERICTVSVFIRIERTHVMNILVCRLVCLPVVHVLLVMLAGNDGERLAEILEGFLNAGLRCHG